MDILELMAAPFAECLVLVAIHTYLGIHVLKRRVIFVDLALAQIAALGTTVGFLFGIMPDTPGALVFSIAFTFLGAAVFSVTRLRHETIPQEAVIGLTYAIACAVAVLVVEKTRGAEHLKDILTGNLLWVTWTDVVTAASVYSVVGVVHYMFRERFLMISKDPDAAWMSGVKVRAWDFLFYLTFGIVIAFSTRVAGVLMVFVFLVAPAIMAFLLTTRFKLQLLIGWAMGTVVTVAGLYLSWTLDLPSGPAVIAFYGVALVLGATTVFVVRARDRLRALGAVGGGTVLVALAVLGIWGGGTWLGSTSIALSDGAREVESEVERDREDVASRESNEAGRRRAAIERRLGGCAGQGKVERYLEMAGPEERLAHVREKADTDRRKALEFLLVALADDETPLLYREEARDLLVETAGEDMGYDPARGAAGNAEALRRVCDRVRAMKLTGNDGTAGSPAP